jgi:hypothetical protein
MNEQQASEKAPGESSGNERCVCREFVEHLQGLFGVSPEVHRHLSNSRIEFLKAIRQVIDDRIERLSTVSQHGAKISVE